jgi:hypothetical protein
MNKYLVVRWPIDDEEQVSPFVVNGNDLETIAACADIDQQDEFSIRDGRYHYGVKDRHTGDVVYRSTYGLGE